MVFKYQICFIKA